eukprot:CAMPEP_0197618680 /NCGR_PEP_ID=MMETSP1326-20131121/61658_1 /TAXON_ID=1155430 /ORGANISM="Genus nov. species nov., Strain RCC2288" /LENGTH=107 /DNA_ID=CAMNT_0043187581 /DNA_START=249 /DNA_END=573 /DNA_ORIENTATION=-
MSSCERPSLRAAAAADAAAVDAVPVLALALPAAVPRLQAEPAEAGGVVGVAGVAHAHLSQVRDGYRLSLSDGSSLILASPAHRVVPVEFDVPGTHADDLATLKDVSK